MTYAWEAALSADRSGIPREQVRYIPVQDGSPYTEVVQEIFNNREVEGQEVGINPLYRFSREFAEIFDRNLIEYENTRRIFFDICMQYEIRQDLRQGMSRQDYIQRFLVKDLMEGALGSNGRRILCSIKRERLKEFLCLILKLYQCGESIHLFREAVRCIYPDSLVYTSNEMMWQVLIFVGRKETMEEWERLVFLQGMFLPVHYEVYLFWEHHFGIVDVEETMVLGEMVLF